MVPSPLNYRCPLAPSILGTQRGRQLCLTQAQGDVGLQTELLELKVLYLGGVSLLVSPPCPDFYGIKEQRRETCQQRKPLSTRHGDAPSVDTLAELRNAHRPTVGQGHPSLLPIYLLPLQNAIQTQKESGG